MTEPAARPSSPRSFDGFVLTLSTGSGCPLRLSLPVPEGKIPLGWHRACGRRCGLSNHETGYCIGARQAFGTVGIALAPPFGFAKSSVVEKVAAKATIPASIRIFFFLNLR
jgi:hypothetical protein